MNIKQALTLLNFYLKKKSINRSFIVCGGASLILQGIISRTTRDIDIVAPPIDQALTLAATSVAEDLGLDSHWLNSGPGSIVKDLKDGWENRVQEIFKDTNLVIYSIAREDLIFTKFWALCDRQKDLEDLILLKPTLEEVDQAEEYTKTKDANPDWSNWVAKQAKRLKKELGYE